MSNTVQAAIGMSAFFLVVGVLAAAVRSFGLALVGFVGAALLLALLALGLVIRSDVLSVAAAVVFLALAAVGYALDLSMTRDSS